jgi:hypothetical protein
MDAYKLKSRLWMIIVVLFVIAFALAGCSSAPKVADSGTQYCHTYQTINKQNGDTVNSDTVIKCSDDVVGKLVDVRAGLAKNCDYAEFVVKKGQNYVPRKVVLCKDNDGDTNVLFSTVVK